MYTYYKCIILPSFRFIVYILAMNLGPPISSLPDVTFEVTAGGSSANDFRIFSHEDLTSPALHNMAENYLSQDNVLP